MNAGGARRRVSVALLMGTIAASIVVVPPATTTGADQVHLEASTMEAMTVPTGYSGMPTGLADDGTVIGGSFPSGAAIVWPSGSPDGMLRVVSGSVITSLWRVDNSGLAVGETSGADGHQHPIAYDPHSDSFTVLSLPTDWQGSAKRISDSGEIVGMVSSPTDGPYVARWSDASSVPVISSEHLSQPLLMPDGRVTAISNGDPVIWDPQDDTVAPLVLPAPGYVIAIDHSGRLLISTYDETSVVWNPATGSSLVYDGPEAQLTDTGFFLGLKGSTWQVVDLATGVATDVRPFDQDLALVGKPVMADDGRVLGRAVDGSTTRVFVWSADAHSVDLLDYPTGGPVTYSPWFLTSTGFAMGTTEVNNLAPRAFWRATFRLSPDAPQGLAGGADGAMVSLSWAAPLSAGDAPIASYRVRADGATVAEVSAGATTWAGSTDAATSYSVVAVNAYGESAPSNAVEVTAAATPENVEPVFTG